MHPVGPSGWTALFIVATGRCRTVLFEEEGAFRASDPNIAFPARPQADPDGSRSLLAEQRRSTELESLIAANPARFRIATGDRPTGPLHLGHYFGTLASRIRLQRAGVQLFLLVADYQVLTDRDVADRLTDRIDGLVADYLAAGIDPAAATIFAHSAVPALNQLMLPVLSLVSVPELRRNPTVKSEIAMSR